MLDGRQRGGGTVDEKSRRAGTHARNANLFLKFGGDVDDVAEAGGRFADRLGVDGYHSKSRSSLVKGACLGGRYSDYHGSLISSRLFYNLLGASERNGDLSRLLAAGLGEIGPTTAAAADDAG